jgi:6-phosphogluconate dehydrogenase
VDYILDTAGQKGTGKWASQDALDIGYPIPTIDASVHARILSAYKAERVAASKILKAPRGAKYEGAKAALVNNVRDALYCSIIADYAQGMGLIGAASKEYKYSLNFSEIARIWKGGCIIRSKLLDPIKQAYKDQPDLKNMMLAPFFAETLQKRQKSWRECIATATSLGIPCLCLATSLAYYDSYRSERLPANLIQGQRDYFGAHTYQRTDREGVFHTEWMAK